MYIRETLTRRTANNTYRSVRLVEGRRVGRKVQQKTLLNLGTAFPSPKPNGHNWLKSLSQSLPGMNTSSSPPLMACSCGEHCAEIANHWSWEAHGESLVAIPRTLNSTAWKWTSGFAKRDERLAYGGLDALKTSRGAQGFRLLGSRMHGLE